MDTKNIERADGKLKFQVVVEAEKFEDAVNKAYLRAKKNIMVPGFRKGKAPRKIVEGMYGKDVFHEDAVEALALETFNEGVKAAGDRTVGDPAIDEFKVGEDGALTISFEVALYPEVTLGEYKGVTAYKPPVEVKDEDIDKELEAVRKRNARIITVDRGAKNGDTVNIDFDGYRDGKRFDGGKAEGHKLVLGSGSLVPGFEEQLLGSKAGEELDVNITFPEDYAPELAGADAVFKVKINEVQETQLPDLDDEFAKDVSEFDTLDEYKAGIRKDMEEKRKELSENTFRANLIRKGCDNMTAEIPDAMVLRRVNDMMEDMGRRTQAQGMSLDQYLQMMGMDRRTYRTYLRSSAANDVRTEVFLGKVAEVEGLTATPEEIEEEYKASAERYGADLERLKKSVPESIIADDIKMKKAGDLILENGVATDKPEKPEDAGAGEAESAEAPAEE